MFETPVAVIGDHELNELLEANATRLGKRCGAVVSRLLIKRLTEALGGSGGDTYSYAWRSAIEDHGQNTSYEDARSALVSGLREVLLPFCEVLPVEAAEVVAELLTSELPTLERIGIYVCGERYEQVGRQFWNHLQEEWFRDLAYWHELFGFLKKSFTKFGPPHQERLVALIKSFKGDWREGADADKLDARRRLAFLHPIQGQGNAEVDELYSKLVQLIGPVGEHPDFVIYRSAGWEGERSPISVDFLLTMTDDELIGYLNEFKPTREWESPSEEGLGMSLRQAIRAEPERFTDMLPRFVNIGRVYQHNVFLAFEELWNDKKDIPWLPILKLAQTLAFSAAFEAEFQDIPRPGSHPNVRWVASDIAKLIHAGTKDDARAFSADLLGLADEIVRQLLLIVPSDAKGRQSDALTEAINTCRGKVLEAFLQLCLRRCRLANGNRRKHSAVWATIKPSLERELQLSERGSNFEFSALAGAYIANLHYLSGRWVKQNFTRVFPLDKPHVWKCAAQGFSYIAAFHPWLFELLQRGGHLEAMLDTDGERRQVREKALQYLVIGYLHGLEDIENTDGLLYRVVEQLRAEDLRYVCWLLWTFRRPKLREVKRDRVVALWRKIAQRLTGQEEAHGRLLSSLNLLVAHVDQVSPEVETLWAQAAPFANVGHHSTQLVENLARLAASNAAGVARVFLAALERFAPTYRPEDVKACLEMLFQKDQHVAASHICNRYAKFGHEELVRSLYEKHVRAHPAEK